MSQTTAEPASVQSWWSEVSHDAPESLGGLWFGLTELVVGGWSLYVAGTAGFDAFDETADWAAAPYLWRPSGPYLAVPEVSRLDISAAIDHCAALVETAGPWNTVPVDGVAVGFDSGDFRVVWTAGSARG